MIRDGVARKYVPIRNTYVKIVQHCRKISVEGLVDKRGRNDFKRTAKRLSKIGSLIG